MNSSLIIIGLSAWMAFVAAGVVWFAWGMIRSFAAWFAARGTSPTPPEPEQKQETPT